MRKVQIEQGSEEWLSWRKGLITATEASSIMGVNPWCTAYKSWQRKVGQIPQQEENDAMRRGKRDEPIARDLFIKQYGIEMTPCCIESEMYNFLGASLDGISPCGKYILEVKSTRPTDRVPDYYYAQMQHQMLCGDGSIDKGFYVSFWEEAIHVLQVIPDIDWTRQYIEKAKEYWRCVVFHEPPEMTGGDYKSMESEMEWQFHASSYIDLCNAIKELEEKKERRRRKLIELCDNNSCRGGGVKVLKKTIKGRIDYESIPEIKEIDLEKHRKPTSISWTILLDQQ